MTPYRSMSGKPSGVIAYETGKESIAVKFTNGSIYLYTYTTAGAKAVEEMKRCASVNLGLSTYIARNDPPYKIKS